MVKSFIKASFFLAIALVVFGLFFLSSPYKVLKWNWHDEAVESLIFPSTFIFGVSTSEYQVSGKYTCRNSNWSSFEDNVLSKKLGYTSGSACDHWARYLEDITYLKELGVKAYRFSIEWSLIEPEEGVFDAAALDHYEGLCQELIKHDIAPV
ncbi:MAG TPA: family 1 glycosylhydrolase, partial [Candidatus Babeliaceae bacterium]|nr:family 1 glycosylhydrolase [Candidatus Babeliaceae bacterium]